MAGWASLTVIALFSLATGWLALRPFLSREPFAGDWLAWVALCLVVGTVIIGEAALLLAEAGLYSLPFLGGVWLAWALVMVIWGYKRRFSWRRPLASTSERPFALLPRRWEKWFLLLWLAAALWLFFRPHQFVIGGADAGVYVNLAANIDRVGSILFQDGTFARLPAAVQAVLSRPIANPVVNSYLLPGFYLMDAANGLVEPQFYPFHPVWQAVAYGLGGATAALLLTGFWALLSCLAIYLFARHLAGWEAAALAVTALSLNAMQVWFARYPTTELQTQFFLWAGFWATAAWLRQRRPISLWAFAAGTSLGAVFLVRIDAIFMLPILLVFLVWFGAERRKGVGWFGAPLLLLVLHSLLHALTQSRPYFFALYEFGVRSMMKNQAVLAALLAAGLAGLWGLFRYRAVVGAWLNRRRRPLLALAVSFLLAFALYNWFVRPYNPELRVWNDQFSASSIADYDKENLLRLGWYLSPVGIWLGFLGVFRLVWRVNRDTAVMLAATLFFTLFYIWNIRNNPHQIYAMRRYVPAVLPLFIVGAAALLAALARRRTLWERGLAVLLAVLWLGGMAWSARGFVSQVDYAGILPQLAQLDAQLAPNAVILFQDDAPVGVGDVVGTPLRFLYGRDVYKIYATEATLPDALAESIKTWQNNGRTVYWIGDPAWLDGWEIPYAAAETTITAAALESSYTQKPALVQQIKWTLKINQLR